MMWFKWWGRQEQAQENNATTTLTRDRRRLERLSIIMLLLARRGPWDDNFKVMTKNINPYGCKFVTTEPVEPADRLHLHLLLHQFHSSVDMEGHVLWVQPWEYQGRTVYEGGLEFAGLQESDRERIRRFIDKYKVLVEHQE